MEFDRKVTNRLKRIDGQLHGVLRMMDEGQGCQDVITQLSAIRAAVDRTIGIIVAENLVDCLKEAQANNEDVTEVVSQAMQLVVKSRA
ncbi:MAG: metal-sensitive transcriptional regulator [Solibacillus sp.]